MTRKLPNWRRCADKVFSFEAYEPDPSPKARECDEVPVDLTGRAMEFCILPNDGSPCEDAVYMATDVDFILSGDGFQRASLTVPRAILETLTCGRYYFYLNIEEVRRADGFLDLSS